MDTTDGNSRMARHEVRATSPCDTKSVRHEAGKQQRKKKHTAVYTRSSPELP